MVLRVNSASDPGLTLKVSSQASWGVMMLRGPFFLLTPLLVLGTQDKHKGPGGQSPARSGTEASSLVRLPQHGHKAWPGVPDRLCTCLTLWGGSSRQGPHLGSQGWQGRRDPQALQRSWAGARSQLRVQRTLVKG